MSWISANAYVECTISSKQILPDHHITHFITCTFLLLACWLINDLFFSFHHILFTWQLHSKFLNDHCLSSLLIFLHNCQFRTFSMSWNIHFGQKLEKLPWFDWLFVLGTFEISLSSGLWPLEDHGASRSRPRPRGLCWLAALCASCGVPRASCDLRLRDEICFDKFDQCYID